jgi:hypothetical protein
MPWLRERKCNHFRGNRHGAGNVTTGHVLRGIGLRIGLG